MKQLHIKTILVAVFALFFTRSAWSQIPIEVMVGNNQIQYQGYFFNTLDKKQRVSFFGMSRFAMDYDNKAFNNSFISSQLTYNLTQSWGISGGASFANNSLSPLLALSYSKFNKKGDFFMNLFPTVLFGDDNVSYEMTGLVIYSPQLTDNFSLFTQLIFTSQFDNNLENHLFSNQQFRVGVGIKDWFQVGLGFDNTLIGRIDALNDNLQPGESINLQNVGIFLRKEL